MEKTMRRITSICIVFMLLCVTGKSMVYACEIDEKNENQQIMIVESGVDIEQISTDELNSVELLVLDEEVYEEQDVHEMQEVLDNGTDILICGDEFEEVSNDFNIEYDIEVGATDVIAGYYLSSNGSEYYVNPIEYELMIDVNDENISNEDKIEILNQILRTEEIDAETIYRDVQSNDGDNWFSSLSDDEKAELQTSTALGNSFTDKSKFVYLYTRQNTSVEPENVYSSAESFTNYQKIGSLRFLLYGINLKTKDSSTYDIVYAECTAGALNSAYVQQFTVGMEISEVAYCSIESISSPDNAAAKTVTLETGINSDGTISSSSSITYTYNPNSLTSIQNVENERYSTKWRCVAPVVTNGSFKVCPSIVVKNTQGTTAPMVTRVFVDDFRVKLRTYTYVMSSKSQLGIKFINHAQY